MEDKKRTELSTLGEFGLIERIAESTEITNPSTLMGIGDDAAVIDNGTQSYTLLSSDMLLEGIDFDLTYFPLRHLGYKAVVVGCSDIYAMNGTPQQITVSLGISAKLSVEDVDELYTGIQTACSDYSVDLVGGDTRASVTGLVVGISVVGSVDKERITYRKGAAEHDIICLTGDLGAAYMGLHLLEREKRVLAGHDNPQPQFKGYEYLLQRQLKPSARRDIIDAMASSGITPTAMIDISDGLASDLLHLCKASGCGARIYLDRLPIAKQTYEMAEQLNADPVVAALNGGDDHELLFTLPATMQERILKMGGIDIIGHTTPAASGAQLVTPDGSHIPITAQGHRQAED